MKQDEKQEKQISRSPKKGMVDFVKGFLLTAVPGLVTSTISAWLFAIWSSGEDRIFVYLLVIFPLGFIFLVTMWVGLRGETFKTKDVQSGVLMGIGVSLVLFVLSCFAFPSLLGA